MIQPTRNLDDIASSPRKPKTHKTRWHQCMSSNLTPALSAHWALHVGPFSSLRDIYRGILAYLGASGEHLGDIWEHLGASGGHLEVSGVRLGNILGHLGASGDNWEHLGDIWRHLWGIWATSGDIRRPSGCHVGDIWRYIGAMWATKRAKGDPKGPKSWPKESPEGH